MVISCLFSKLEIYGIHWNGNWAFGCDFNNNDVNSVLSCSEECSGKCVQMHDCIHFIWTRRNEGTCWMKEGSVSKANAVSTDDSTMVCDVLHDNTNSGRQQVFHSTLAFCPFTTKIVFSLQVWDCFYVVTM